MKVKKLSKKLVLNKRTIAHLDIHQMKNAAGGEATRTVHCTVLVTFDPCENECYSDMICPTNPLECTISPCSG